MIFVFVYFSVFVVVVFLCCYVVKLGKAKKAKRKKNTPQKWKHFWVVFTRQVMVACAKVIVVFVLFCCFCLVVAKTLLK